MPDLREQQVLIPDGTYSVRGYIDWDGDMDGGDEEGVGIIAALPKRLPRGIELLIVVEDGEVTQTLDQDLM